MKFCHLDCLNVRRYGARTICWPFGFVQSFFHYLVILYSASAMHTDDTVLLKENDT